ncbi:MAG: hypothetical protein U0324_13645 [Polyangiales bacterium]
MRRAGPAACGLALALAAGAARAQSGDAWFGADKALHFTASALIAGGGYALGAGCFEATAPRVLLGAGLGLAAGVGKELVDLAGYGDPSWRDLAWDALGVGVGVTAAWLVDRALRPTARPPRPAWTLAPSIARAGVALTLAW